MGLGRTRVAPVTAVGAAPAGCAGDRRAALAVLLAIGVAAASSAGGTGIVVRRGAASLAVLVPASLWEELFLRGYAFAVLRRAMGRHRWRSS